MEEKEIKIIHGQFKRIGETKALILASAFVLLYTGLIFATGAVYGDMTAKRKIPSNPAPVESKVEVEQVSSTNVSSSIAIEEVSSESAKSKLDISEEDIELIALVTMAEAEGECELGKRLVIDVILNRVASEHFPDTVEGVVYQPNQFTSMWNGRSDRCYVKEDICQLVREELERQVSYDVAFFRTKHYSDYGYPLIQCGAHYFSIYE